MQNDNKTPPKAYDKIIKENLEAILLPLSELLLGIEIHKSEKLKEKLQTTLEREPDFIRKIEAPNGDRFILHLEFQSSDEKGMVYRMKEYEAILSRKYGIPVHQFVVYIGDGKSKMRTWLKEEEIFKGFELLEISSIKAEKLLEREVPEAIMLAILADFNEQEYKEILFQVYTKIKQLSKDELQLRKYLRQLKILSRLRKLEQETTKLIEEMPITYDINTDYLYNRGKEEKLIEIVRNLLKSSAFINGILSYEEIATSCGVTVQEVKKIQDGLKMG